MPRTTHRSTPECKLKYELYDYDPNPREESLVISSDGKFRAQILTEDLFRFEYSESSTFENRPTLTFLNRNLTDYPKFNHYEQDGKLLILTKDFNITYVVGSGLKTSEDLRVVCLNADRRFNGDSSFVWQYGMKSETDEGNLFGTYRTLDGTDNPTLDCKVNKKDHCVYGLISKNGWATVPITILQFWIAMTGGQMTILTFINQKIERIFISLHMG